MCYMCEVPSPLFRGRRTVVYICEYSLHCICEPMLLGGIYVTFIHLHSDLAFFTDVLMVPIFVSYS